MGIALQEVVAITNPRRHLDSEPALDRFFDFHLAGVQARLEAQTARALERQKTAWRDALHREALLEDKDFEQAEQAGQD